MNREGIAEVYSPDAPEPVGPYSQAVAAGGAVYISGQIGLDPRSGEMREGAGAQARQALDNLTAVARAAGCGMDRIVRVTVYLADMSDFQEVNSVYSCYFGKPFPSRVTVGVAGLPLGALVEIDAVAVPDGGAS